MARNASTAQAHAGVDVLTNRVLWDAVTACQTGYPRAVADFLHTSRATCRDKLESAKQTLTPATALVVGHLTRCGELVHLAIAAHDAAILDTLHRLATRAQYQHDVKLCFKKAMRCAVVCNSVSMLEHIVKLKCGNSDSKGNYESNGDGSTVDYDQVVWEPNLMSIALLRDDPDPRMLDWLVAHLPRTSYSLTHKFLVFHAARGNLRAVQWLHELGRAISQAAMDAAARNNRLQVLQYLYAHSDKRCSYDGADVTAERGYTDIVKLLLAKQRRQVSPRVIEYAAMCGHVDIVQLCVEHPQYEVSRYWMDAMQLAALHGHLSVVKYLHESCPSACSSMALDSAARNGHLAIVQYLHENNHATCSHVCEPSAFDEAAKKGCLDVVKFLVEHRTEGKIVDALEAAALRGHLAIVQLLHARLEHGESTFAAVCAAVRQQHFDVAGFLCEHEEHVFERILSQAVTNDLLHVVKTAARFASTDELVDAQALAEELSRPRIAASLSFTIKNRRRQQQV